MAIKDSLADVRKRAGLTQDESARRVGVTTFTLSRIENGVQQASPALMEKLAEVYKVKVKRVVRLAHRARVARLRRVLRETAA